MANAVRRWQDLVAVFLGLQGFLVAGWWGLLLFRPDTRAAWKPEGFPDAYLLAFFLPDALFLVAGSWWALAGLAFNRVRAAERLLPWLAGAWAYAGLYCLGLALWTGSGWLAPIVMVPAAALNVWLGLESQRRDRS